MLSRLQNQGLKSLYHNSGAFGFANGVPTISRGWIGPEDASIAPAGRAIACQIAPPFESNLAALFTRFWRNNSPAPIWIMPKSHWAYELQFGGRQWLSDALNDIGIHSDLLMHLNNATAVEFQPAEEKTVHIFIQNLLTNLVGSDFQAVFADSTTICTIHSRSQLWWTTVVPAIADRLDELLPVNASPYDSQTE